MNVRNLSALLRAALLLYVSACMPESSGNGDRPFVAAISTDPGHLNSAITTNGSVHSARMGNDGQ